LDSSSISLWEPEHKRFEKGDGDRSAELGVLGAKGVVCTEIDCDIGADGTTEVKGLIGSGRRGGIITDAGGKRANP
jgi:hypothetical protein